MTAELGDIEAATLRLAGTVRGLTDADLAAPSLCAGWTRGHVVTHVARNADSLVNLLTWARTGVETPQYVSLEARAADIEAGAGRPVAAQLADLDASAQRFAEAVVALPVDRWDYVVRMRGGVERRAADLLDARLREVEIHHVDLAAGYGPADWPEPFVARTLRQVARLREAERHDDGALTVAGVTVTGPAPDLLAWLLGRSDGAGLTASGPLPDLGDYG